MRSSELARDAGLEVPRDERPGERERRAESASLTDLLLAAAHFYRAELKDSPRAIEYLKGRGLTGEIAARFGLGYAPDAWQSLLRVFPNYEDPMLESAGLVIAGDGDKRYDRFRDRIMFPIHDHRGHVIGFGGRVIDQGEPKYLNSPETPVFSKGRELYGLYHARSAIRDAGKVVVVEGYMDVVALAQHGVGYAVATLGTATTPIHVQKLFRQTDSVVYLLRRRRRRQARRVARAREHAGRRWPTARTRSSCSCPTARIPTTSCASAAAPRSRPRSPTPLRCRSSCSTNCRHAIRRPPPKGRLRSRRPPPPTSPTCARPSCMRCCAGAWPN